MSEDNETDVPSAQPAARSWPLEILGIISVLGFFIGIAWAWQVQVGAIISADQFEQIQIGQTLEEVEHIFRNKGRKVTAENDASDDVEYVWENSTDSKATCVFADGKLVGKSSKNLP